MDYPVIKIDWSLLIPLILLVSLGLLMLRSVAPSQLMYQAIFALISAVVFAIFAYTDYRLFFSFHVPIYIAAILAMLLPYVFGAASRGAHRWLQFGQVFLQPSEGVKPFLLITFAILAASSIKYKQLWLVTAFALPALIIFLQPDLGTMLVLAIGWLTIFLPQIPRRLLLVGAIVVTLVSPVVWLSLRDYQRDRLITFVDPYSDPLGKGYQVIQSTIAVGSGQFWGRGLGQGTQSQLRFLPEQHTDFMFAALAEELGFVGACLVIGLFIWIFIRIYVISQHAPDLAANFFCLGVLAMLAFQVFVNVGMNIGVAPVTGITLPFVSYGGSSLVSLAVTLGLVAGISHQSSTLKIVDSWV